MLAFLLGEKRGGAVGRSARLKMSARGVPEVAGTRWWGRDDCLDTLCGCASRKLHGELGGELWQALAASGKLPWPCSKREVRHRSAADPGF